MFHTGIRFSSSRELETAKMTNLSPLAFLIGEQGWLAGIGPTRYWQDFGGKRKPGETALQTAAREMKAETGISIQSFTSMSKHHSTIQPIKFILNIDQNYFKHLVYPHRNAIKTSYSQRTSSKTEPCYKRNRLIYLPFVLRRKKMYRYKWSLMFVQHFVGLAYSRSFL